MYEEQFAHRLASLRIQLNISARDMSLSLGQNPGYINAIENHKTFPTMVNFFYICEFLNVTPQEFFDLNNTSPHEHNKLIENLKHLSTEQLDAISIIVKSMTNNTCLRHSSEANNVAYNCSQINNPP